jgi:hypothetical protein
MRLRNGAGAAALAALAVAIPAGLAPDASAQTPGFNYAEALQKAIFFFEEQVSGPTSWNRVTWRGNSRCRTAPTSGAT